MGHAEKALGGSSNYFSLAASLYAPVKVVGAENLPAIPLNSILEKTMLPNADKVEIALQQLLAY